MVLRVKSNTMFPLDKKVYSRSLTFREFEKEYTKIQNYTLC